MTRHMVRRAAGVSRQDPQDGGGSRAWAWRPGIIACIEQRGYFSHCTHIIEAGVAEHLALDDEEEALGVLALAANHLHGAVQA